MSNTDKSIPVVDDQARRDGGKQTHDQQVPVEQLEKIKKNAVDHSKEEPGS